MTSDIVLNTEETDPDALIRKFFSTFPDYSEEDRKRISSAWQYLISKTASLKRGCGKPYYLHPMRVAFILGETRMDADCIIAGMFHNILDAQGTSSEEITNLFGENVSRIISEQVCNFFTACSLHIQ